MGPQGFSVDLFLRFLVVGEASLAADLIIAWETLRGGCGSSRLAHGLEDPAGRLQLQPNRSQLPRRIHRAQAIR